MKAGQLRETIRIQSQVSTQDSAGQPVQTWADLATERASVVDVTGREYVAANAVAGSATTKITIRHREGVTPAMRLIHGTTVYNIHAVLGQDRISLMLMCSRAT
jgi:SPP1 family predicted phage head-tail adaptor